ncbi:hypothetical protein [Halomarina rubra]|uniref:Sulfatase n=1 Tax=Halomarina rubra TaxID=2071873 RepID=A0ABD6AW25_9EURY|nr:hypothetical protein [Halomarina rubra]
MSLLGSLSTALSDLSANYDDPQWRRNRLVDRVSGPLSRQYSGTGGIDVPGSEWDNLLVLDACRADVFEAVADLDAFDAYRRVTSQASMTAEWTQRNWTDGAFGDTVYVTANPLVSRHAPDSFHELHDVWHDGFDDESGTVLPETLADAARAAFRDDKRLVAHFVQPHAPFYATDLGLDEVRPSWAAEDATYNEWEAVRNGDLSAAAALAGYAETLERGLESALALAADLPGRTVLTSDHGDLYGQRVWPLGMRLYGHPRGHRHPDLVEVPWAVLDGERRAVTDEGTTRTEAVDDDVVTDRLEALGYA